MKDERTEFGRALSTWILKHRGRLESPASIVGTLVGTAAAEHIFEGQTREEFLEICAYAYDEVKKASDALKS